MLTSENFRQAYESEGGRRGIFGDLNDFFEGLDAYNGVHVMEHIMHECTYQSLGWNVTILLALITILVIDMCMCVGSIIHVYMHTRYIHDNYHDEHVVWCRICMI